MTLSPAALHARNDGKMEKTGLVTAYFSDPSDENERWQAKILLGSPCPKYDGSEYDGPKCDVSGSYRPVRATNFDAFPDEHFALQSVAREL